MHLTDEFKLRQAIAVCPACNAQFDTPYLLNVPAITSRTALETDLHRVLPDPAIRAALIGLCLDCGYGNWISHFEIKMLEAECFAVSDSIEYPRKFANAFITARSAGASHVELALIALNGGWCSREADLPYQRWLDLAAQELDKALFDKSWGGDRGYYHYLMAEICRQLSDFTTAVRHFNKATLSSRLPKQLITRQKVQAIAADPSHTLLPPHLVERLFCPKRPLRLPAI
ncbi:MAG: hypothetical protein U0105_10650 [Candidatus Obscuribacterales bacterium]|jgi:hypothetical protein